METIQIGEQAGEALNSLAALSDDAVRELSKLLDDVPFRAFPASDAIQHAAAVTLIDRDVAANITQLLLSLWFSQANSKRNAKEIVREVTAQFARDTDPKDLPDGALDTIARHLLTLLEKPNLLNGQNASSLILDYERIWSSGRILTDMRPVFDAIDADKICGAVVTHTLRISHYKSDGTSDEFFVALDDRDLEQLCEMLDRAKLKAKALKNLLDTSNVGYVRNSNDEL